MANVALFLASDESAYVTCIDLVVDGGNGLLAAWKDLPGLLAGRLLTGVSAGLAADTPIT